MFTNALEHHQHGRLAEAERLYRQILAIDPQHSDALHLLGVLAHQVGRDELAVKLIDAAIAINKQPAVYHSNLGTAFQTLGKLEKAQACFEQALALQPEFAEARMNLGVVLQALGKLELAEECFRQTLALRPEMAEVHVNLGNILQAQGKLKEAVASHERALALKPNFVEAAFNRANALQAQGKLEEAAAGYRQALVLNPEMVAAYGNLGNTLLAMQKLDDAVACYQQALALKPDYAEAWYNLGNAHQAQQGPDTQDKLEAAVDCYRHALKVNPQLPEAHYNLGNTLHSLDRLDESAAAFAQALTFRPEYPEAEYNLGCVLEDLNQLDEAREHILRSLDYEPDYHQARFGLALLQLRCGDFATGWRSYESRWQSPDHDTPWRPYAQPLWNGKKLSAGRLLLWGEQGIGDEIQFAGLIPDAIRTGNRITLDCDARLQPLFARSFPQIEVVTGLNPAEAQKPRRPVHSDSDQVPLPASVSHAAQKITAHLPTGSLPALFRNTEVAFAATTAPYLKPDPLVRERFRARLSDGRKLVGLAWHTRNKSTGRKRSIDLQNFASLFTLPGIRWVSLQYGDFDDLEHQAAAAAAPLLIDRSVDQLADMDRFAAQVAALDQVVTIDNSTAHLAGALGLPVLLLLPHAADWRWLLQRDDSPWYPTLRILRQSRRNDWRSVLDEVRQHLCGETE
jgi:tetratricopeptide (TPR) repeat protein